MKIRTLERNFISCNSSLQDSQLALLGIPFDGTVSFRAGARMAPSVLRNESIGLETYSPYQDMDLEDFKINDIGDLDLPFGNTTKTLKVIEQSVLELSKNQKRILSIGGEHLVTYPIVKALLTRYPDLCLVHFDAHADLRDDYLGEKLSHATALRRVWDMVGDERIWQYGIRSGSKEEFRWSQKGHTFMEKFTVNTVENCLQHLSNKPVYITIDVDVLDPSVVSGTGTPEAGGVQFTDLLQALLKLKPLNIVGADVVELSPMLDTSGASTAVVNKIIRELMILMLT